MLKGFDQILDQTLQESKKVLVEMSLPQPIILAIQKLQSLQMLRGFNQTLNQMLREFNQTLDQTFQEVLVKIFPPLRSQANQELTILRNCKQENPTFACQATYLTSSRRLHCQWK